ncbi:peptidase T [Oribacterium sp. oral taxon 108]|uniref:peptidase T n=1 Tax=Oribacterium sp. oral taxon 108 TaxID=712414 RepID=UPI00020DD668|nr:peptidase T [Oribacterium sp. oral taxon 108]EGL38318.1 peptidase T [Oribacterium sp. oral taxon 108 str. F0425]
MDAVERLISYLKIDTESVPDRDVIPSSEKQFDLAKVLEKELREMGVSDVRLDEHCYVYGKLPSNLSGEEKAKTPALGLIAHMDTSPSARGKNVNPRIVKNYDGTDIVLNEEEKLSPKIFPRLLEQVGDDLLVTDGTTLLGADDKAGVAEIMALVEYLQKHKEIPHGDICIGFTPDEEVGCGADIFDVKGFGADVAYTVDGGKLGGVEYENFNGASGKLKIHGVNVHPGSAKDKMLNSLLLAMEFNSMLPQFTPANTEGYEGFFHLCDMAGDESLTEMNYIIRDHDREKFEEKKRIFLDVAEKLNQKYNAKGAFFEPEVKDSYFNMAEKVKDHMYLIDVAKTAFEKEGITPIVSPIRGGTDGASLSYKGLPCPNLSTGGDNFHGIYEYLNLNAFHKMIAVLIQITQEMIGKKA